MKLNSVKVVGAVSGLDGVELMFPVRRSGDDGSEFILLSEWSADLQHANSQVLNSPPGWNKANPVVRFARVKLVAVEVE